ncbi:MAG: hypothetical protein Q9163_003955 [Psora crenata]
MGNYSQRGDDAGGGFEIASLRTIKLEALRSGSRTESEQLLRACRNDGFFYLDMIGTVPQFEEALNDIFALECDLFRLPKDELMKYDIDKLSSRKLNGYKPLGRNRGGLEGGKDGFESYALPKDGILDISPFQRPEIVTTHLAALRTFCSAISTAATTILTILSSLLQIQPGTPTLQSLHRSHLPTPDMVRLLKYHALPYSKRGATTHIAHTDLGSLTFLLRRQYGLQVQRLKSPGCSEEKCWVWVKPPVQGHVIVNLGDGLSMLTARYLKSCLHRVIPYPGDEMSERYSFAYFMRAEDEVVMRALKSPLFGNPDATGERMTNAEEGGDAEAREMTSAQWLQKKYTMLRKDTWSRDNQWILTGVKEVKQS